MMKNHISIEPSPFLPQTTIAIEKVKITAIVIRLSRAKDAKIRILLK